MKKFKNIMIFQYGLNKNGCFITEEAVKDAFNDFINKPVMIFNDNDLYNKENNPIGVINKVNNYEYPYVYGDIIVYKDQQIKGFRNYSIKVEEKHDEDGITYIDKFKLCNVSFDI